MCSSDLRSNSLSSSHPFSCEDAIVSRVAILGGGVAGLASAHRLLEAGFDVRVLERKRLPRGIGFLLLDNGRAAARRLGVWGALLAAAHPINGFELRAPGSCPAVPGARDAAGNVRQQIPLDVHSFVYADFVSRLAEGLPDGTVRRGPAVVGLDREADGRVVAARLDDGDRIEADLFVASDGVRSIARAALFPEARLRPCQVHELVNIVDAPGVAERLGRAFVKYEDPKAEIGRAHV